MQCVPSIAMRHKRFWRSVFFHVDNQSEWMMFSGLPIRNWYFPLQISSKKRNNVIVRVDVMTVIYWILNMFFISCNILNWQLINVHWPCESLPGVEFRCTTASPLDCNRAIWSVIREFWNMGTIHKHPTKIAVDHRIPDLAMHHYWSGKNEQISY